MTTYVYLVWEEMGDYEADSLCGVFSSTQKAGVYINKQSFPGDFRVEEYEVK